MTTMAVIVVCGASALSVVYSLWLEGLLRPRLAASITLAICGLSTGLAAAALG